MKNTKKRVLYTLLCILLVSALLIFFIKPIEYAYSKALWHFVVLNELKKITPGFNPNNETGVFFDWNENEILLSLDNIKLRNIEPCSALVIDYLMIENVTIQNIDSFAQAKLRGLDLVNCPITSLPVMEHKSIKAVFF